MDNSPLTKQDLLDLRGGLATELKTQLDQQSQELRLELRTALNQQSHELRQELTPALEQQSHELQLEFKQDIQALKDRLEELRREVETRVIRPFLNNAECHSVRLHTMEVTEGGALLRLGALEDQVWRLETSVGRAKPN